MVECTDMETKRYIPGFLVALAVASFSFLISSLHASFDPLVISIIFGVLLGNIIVDKEHFANGVHAALSFFLPIGIALYGSQLVFTGIDVADLIKIFAVFLCLFGLTFLVSRSFNINNKISILLASGLAVCGASAIAVISPLIGARKEDTSVSIISVMMLGLAGMIFYPVLADILSLARSEYNFLTGTTLPMLGQVKVAAASYCPDCVSEAIRIKLIRISFLVFLVTLAIALSGQPGKKISVPWFIIAFIILAVIFNTVAKAALLISYFRNASSFALSAALAAIGFSVDFDAIVEEGLLPLSALFLSWAAIILVIYLFRNLF